MTEDKSVRAIDSQMFAAHETQGSELKSLAVLEPGQLSSEEKTDGEVDGVSLSVEFRSSQSSRQ